MLNLSMTTSPDKLFDYDSVTVSVYLDVLWVDVHEALLLAQGQEQVPELRLYLTKHKPGLYNPIAKKNIFPLTFFSKIIFPSTV